MRWWPFGRRRDGGRHSFGAAVTSLPTGPLRLGEPEPLPETVLAWGAVDDLDASSVWSDGASHASGASSDWFDAFPEPGPFSLGALLGQSDDASWDDSSSAELSSTDPSWSTFDLDRELPQAASPALTVVPGAAWTGPDLDRPLEVAPLHASSAVSEEPLGPPAEAGPLSLPVLTFEPRRVEEPRTEEPVPFGHAVAEEPSAVPFGHAVEDVSLPFGYEVVEDVSVPFAYEALAESLTIAIGDEHREDPPVLLGDEPVEHLTSSPVPLLGLDAAYPLPGPVFDVPVVQVPVVHVHVPVDVPVVQVVDVPLGQEPVAVAVSPLPVPAPVLTEPVRDAAVESAPLDAPPEPAAPVRRRTASSAVFVPTPPAPRPVDPLPWLGTVCQESSPRVPTVEEEVTGELHFRVEVAPSFVPAGPPLSPLTGLLPEPRGDQHDQSPARVQLGFRDGSNLVLPPGSEPSRALQELARILLARH